MISKNNSRFEEWIMLQKETKEKEKADRKAENLRRRLNPRTEKDFELVWHALEQWREEQIALINETTQTPAETKAALATLQEQVAQLVAAIGRHRYVEIFIDIYQRIFIGHVLQKSKKNKEFRNSLTHVQHQENGKHVMANGFKWSIGPNLKMESLKWIRVIHSGQKNFEIYTSE